MGQRDVSIGQKWSSDALELNAEVLVSVSHVTRVDIDCGPCIDLLRVRNALVWGHFHDYR